MSEEATAPVSGPRIGILTSGGDAQGMNAVVRAAVRTALRMGAQPYAVLEGWQGAVEGGDGVRQLQWESVGSILHKGGTVIGTARSDAFRERWGMLAAAKNLLAHGIDRLIVIGGDGSLTGTEEFRTQWPSLLDELVETGQISPEVRDAHPKLTVTGVVGSIDNDMVGTDMTVGTDSALHRIVDALDAISSTAASHQRTFIIEVMGRHCGYLALMAAVAGGCDYVLIPENPPAPGWEQDMVDTLRRGREQGRRDSLVIVAEGARDRDGAPITSTHVQQAIKDLMGESARVTILGHVQRGGAPSAYDRWMSTLLGYAAAQEVINSTEDDEPHIMGVRRNRIARLPLRESVAATRAVKDLLAEQRYAEAISARGQSFTEMVRIFSFLATPPGTEEGYEVFSEQAELLKQVRAIVKNPDGTERAPRVGVLHQGGLAPGMNSAARAVTRLGLQLGMTVLGIRGSFQGLIDGRVSELTWGEVDSWVGEGGAELGTRRPVPEVEKLYSLGRAIEEHCIDALIIIGGFNGYLSAHLLHTEQSRYPAFQIPIICIPASIDNNLPGTELAIGADTALNEAVRALDMIRQSASASRRCFVAETMGRRCGYLAAMSGLAAGAEKVYLAEEGITLEALKKDTEEMIKSFQEGRRLYLAIRSEQASELYTTDFLARLFAEEGKGLYDVRQNVLGHIQQGGNPSPFDRLLATRLAYVALSDLVEQLLLGSHEGRYVGLMGSKMGTRPIARMEDELDLVNRRPRKQWWMELRSVSEIVSDRHTRSEAASLPVLRAEPERK
ncbi:6-phosphofructokinase [Buchananella hordeovulneris]|uniref:6-phosphofructokinase n=3 Tax=Buchananella hordeovulneris TaxID=52770 RepID=A0A1Q5PZD7_9ACTO|nr:6-phosphofructokinase [Buchananella hordeovulneris]OKL52805.1 6-phosphofructokinase [Buchananella hordeovulneris]RRD43610.1 6-phosphofructokinase [Buchananella hordeovulneris]